MADAERLAYGPLLSPELEQLLPPLTVSDASHSSNTVTAVSGTPVDLYVPEVLNSDGSSAGYATINLHEDASAASGASLPWTIGGASASKNGGTVTQAADDSVTLTPTGGNYDFDLQVVAGEYSESQAVYDVVVHVYTVAVEFNDTPATNDDIVMLGTPAEGPDIPPNQPELGAAVQMVGDGPSGLTVTLDNPDGRLGFGEGAPSSEPLSQPSSPVPTQPSTPSFTLPTDGSWQYVSVFGLGVSAAVGDASVRVSGSVLRQVGGFVLGKKGATVFWFSGSSITVQPAGNYASVNNGPKESYTVDTAVNNAASAVTIQGSATLTPAGIDPNAPQLTALRIGFVQNAVNSMSVVTYANPVQGAAVNGGGIANVAPTEVYTIQVPTLLNDSAVGSTPLYAQPGNDFNDPLTSNSVQYANGVAQPSTIDTPSLIGWKQSLTLNADDANGNVVGTVTYSLASLAIDDVFRDFLVVGVADSNQHVTTVIAPLKETGWHLNVNSAAANPNTQVAIVNGDANGGSPPTDAPILSGALLNDEIANPANLNLAGVGNPIQDNF